MGNKSISEMEQLKKQASQGSAEACFELAERLYAQRNYTEAFKWYQKTTACENPNPVAYFNIAYALQFGEGAAVDMVSSFENYQKAAAHHLPQAMYNLAFFYQNGIVVPKDEEKAVRLCREATMNLNKHESELYKLNLDHERLLENYYVSMKLIDEAEDRIKLTEENDRKIQAENKDLLKKNSSLTDENLRRKNELQTLQSRNKHLSDENQKLEDNLKHAERISAEKDETINSLDDSLTQMRKSSDELSEKYYVMVRSLEELHGENEALSKSLKYCESSKDEISGLNKQLRDKFDEKEQEYLSLTQQYQRLNENYIKLDAECVSQKEFRANSEARVKQLSDEMNKLRLSLAQSDNECKQKEAEFNTKLQDLTKLKNKMTILAGVLGGSAIAALIGLIVAIVS